MATSARLLWRGRQDAAEGRSPERSRSLSPPQPPHAAAEPGTLRDGRTPPPPPPPPPVVGAGLPGLSRTDLGTFRPIDLGGSGSNRGHRRSACLRRVADILGGIALLLLTLPVQLAVAAVVLLESPGPLFHRQQRAGLHGAPFPLFKFRTARVEGAEADGPSWAPPPADARVTRAGRWLRLLRLDELPQLLNVLRGDMSLIGPRPERPHIVALLATQVPHYALRHVVKPGITGWAQVNHPYGASVEDARAKLAYDLYYIQHQSWRFDLRILLATLGVVLRGTGAR